MLPVDRRAGGFPILPSHAPRICLRQWPRQDKPPVAADPAADSLEPRGTMNDVSSSPKTPEELYALLDDLGVSYSTRTHAPVFTVAESVGLRDEIPGGHTKNLFVKDKKDQYFVLTVEENAAVDLKTVHKVIGASSRVSFGKPEKMLEYLGVAPGSVTVFGAINDTGNNVTFILDEDLMQNEVINGHPLSNDATTSIERNDLLRFLEATGHTPLVLKVTD
jgi:Ala-tRNA(Pro) deacylase